MTSTTRIRPLEDYATSRQQFLARAEADGAFLEAHAHPLPGTNGEPLGTDVARFGAPPGAAHTVVLIGSGLHGVEGHAGWGLQMLTLEGGRLGALPDGVAVLLVHAINPYGMAWSRRVDHDNIDVNRNWVDFTQPLPRNEHYAAIDHVLNPDGVEFDLDDTAWVDALWAFAAEIGMEAAFRAISGGQYDVPAGMQFGGQGPSWSQATLRKIWAAHIEGAEALFNVDIHTGLGPCGGLTIFQTADEGEPAADVAREWFPTVLRVDRTSDTDPLQVGVLGPGLDASVEARTVTVPIVAEFGTHDESTVLAAMRADNWLHQHGDLRSPIAAQVRERTRDAFFVDDEGWRASVAADGMATIDAALDAAATRPLR